MNHGELHLSVLLVEDDKENLDLLIQSLPQTIADCRVHYDPCDSFDTASDLLKWRRYDMIVSDIYRDRADTHSKVDEEDALAGNIVEKIRKSRFCPVVLFTDGSFPAGLDQQKGPFLKLVDKSAADNRILKAIEEILATQIPQTARRLHDELDQVTGPKYLWEFLVNKWADLERSGQNSPEVIDRLVRRRAAIQIGRLKPDGEQVEETKSITSAEYYLMPPVSDVFKLGHILRSKDTGNIVVLLTPHCYLEIQNKTTEPRADYVQLIQTIRYEEIAGIDQQKDPRRGSTEPKKLDRLRRLMQSPARIGQPEGRFWFLPGFLEIPDLFCDFLQVESVKIDELSVNYKPLAILDAPFAEAFQSCYTSFYSSVGLPNLSPRNFVHLIADPQEKDG